MSSSISRVRCTYFAEIDANPWSFVICLWYPTTVWASSDFNCCVHSIERRDCDLIVSNQPWNCEKLYFEERACYITHDMCNIHLAEKKSLGMTLLRLGGLQMHITTWLEMPSWGSSVVIEGEYLHHGSTLVLACWEVNHWSHGNNVNCVQLTA